MLPCQHFCQGALGQKFQFLVQKGLFLLQNVFISDFLARIRAKKSNFSAKFQLHWTKDKGTRILTWNDTKKGLRTSCLVMTSANFLWLLRDFVPEYHHATFGCNWTTNKRETEGGGGREKQCAPSLYGFKRPSLNSPKNAFVFCRQDGEDGEATTSLDA